MRLYFGTEVNQSPNDTSSALTFDAKPVKNSYLPSLNKSLVAYTFILGALGTAYLFPKVSILITHFQVT